MSGSVDEYKPNEVVLENIKPVGQVNIAGQPGTEATPTAEASAAPAPAEAAPATPKTGEQIYQTYCIACHGTGAAGAPKFGNAAAWKPRIAKGMDALLNSAIHGLNAMPPRGTCMSCTDAELKGAIQYMVSKSQ
jgi:cytochrome c5